MLVPQLPVLEWKRRSIVLILDLEITPFVHELIAFLASSTFLRTDRAFLPFS